MAYTPFELRVMPLFFYYIALSILGIVMTLKMYYKWRERKVNPPLYLSIVFLFLTAALIMLTIGLAEAVITGYYMEVYRFSLPFSYGMVIIADIFLFKFVIELLDKGKKVFIPLIILGLIIFIMLFLPWNWWGIPPEDYAGELNIRLYSTISLVLYSYVVYILIARTSLKAAKATQDATTKLGLKHLFYAMISMILFFLMFIGDTLMILFGHPGYSEFVYIAWIFAILFYIFAYISLVMPKWVLKRIGK
ncbi:MAG: hypothetical protein MUP85_11545 [Candidatus Lokiarchaeota archaeon]|nr:hypothetical protein [Candidatus Lokiarchaeota archaeon]